MRGNLNRNKFVYSNKSIKMDMGQSNVQTVLFFPFWELKQALAQLRSGRLGML